ncbi:hypothetical protein [Methylocaldum gracile]|jgi:hypothetical protein|uniref:hypothetical protein n=1 Tax=unclassified Methylocaldum TaxID=2622260 RepID=UPI00105BB835
MELVIDKKNTPLSGIKVAFSVTTGTVVLVLLGENRLPVGVIDMAPQSAMDLGRMLLSAATLPKALADTKSDNEKMN